MASRPSVVWPAHSFSVLPFKPVQVKSVMRIKWVILQTYMADSKTGNELHVRGLVGIRTES
jgi:hypothetical protein